MPYVSVIVPTMRCGGVDIFLESAAQSKFTDFEIVLVDSLYSHRRERLSEEAKDRFLRLVHVGLNPQPNYCCFCAMANAGIAASSGEVLLFMVDYSRIPFDLISAHAIFHKVDPTKRAGMMGPHRYIGLDVDPRFPKYKSDDIAKYENDVQAHILDPFMWSLGKPIDRPSEPHNADGGAVVPHDADPKLRMPPGSIHNSFFHGKNESVHRERVLEINGWDQELDGAHLYQDSDFADRLTVKAGVSWMLDPSQVVEIANPRHVFPYARRLRPHESNKEIWERKRAAGYPIQPSKALHLIPVRQEKGSLPYIQELSKDMPDYISPSHLMRTAQSWVGAGVTSCLTSTIYGRPLDPIPMPADIRVSASPMKIAMIYGEFSSAIHGPFDLAGLYTKVGLTGSESSFFNLARTLAERGHKVVAFCVCDAPFEHPSGLVILPMSMLKGLPQMQLDAVIAWNEPDYLQFAPSGVQTYVDQQLNDWGYVRNPQWQSMVGTFVFPSESSRLHHLNDLKLPGAHSAAVIPNSVDLELFLGLAPVRHPRRVVYCSSPDRGLHHLLSMWPAIRKEVPDAELKIFYRIGPWLERVMNNPDEVGKRARYIGEAIPKLRAHGVTVVGPVPNAQMATELRSAAVLAYPCDPVSYTEGFGCSVLDAAAAECIPIISDADALPHVHRSAAIVIQGNPGGVLQREAWVKSIVASLISKEMPEGWNQRMREHAKAHSRQAVTDLWERLLGKR